MPYRVGEQVGTIHKLEKVDHPIVKFFKTIGNIIGGIFVVLIAFAVLGAILGGK